MANNKLWNVTLIEFVTREALVEEVEAPNENAAIKRAKLIADSDDFEETAQDWGECSAEEVESEYEDTETTHDLGGEG